MYICYGFAKFVFDKEGAGMARINSIHSSFKAMGYYIKKFKNRNEGGFCGMSVLVQSLL